MEASKREKMATKLNQRQPDPVKGTGRCSEMPVQPHVIAHLAGLGHEGLANCLQERAKIGKEKYGTLVYPQNGRDCFVDAFQELMDAIFYVGQAEMEGQLMPPSVMPDLVKSAEMLRVLAVNSLLIRELEDLNKDLLPF